MHIKKKLYALFDLIKKQPDQYPIWQRMFRFAFLKFFNRNKLANPDKSTITNIRLQANNIVSKPNTSKAENKWMMFKEQIKKRILNENINGFIFWPEIRHNMHYTPDVRELSFLKKSSRWDQYSRALEMKSKNIKQIPFFAFRKANENSIRQGFGLESFFVNTGLNINSFDQVFEFGGGYGSACTLIKRLGFNGEYLIFDWPEMSIIQKYYLQEEGVFDDKLAFESEVENIRGKLKGRKTLLIATWSLSECSFELRDKILETVKPDFILIGYQKEFAGIQNKPYFDQLRNRMNDLQWTEIDLEYIPSQKNKYLFARRK